MDIGVLGLRIMKNLGLHSDREGIGAKKTGREREGRRGCGGRRRCEMSWRGWEDRYILCVL